MKLVWYVTDKDFLPFPSVINSLDSRSDPWTEFLLGEQFDFSRDYNGRGPVAGLHDGHFCGQPSDFENGQPWPYTGPPIEYDEDGIPYCCPRDRTDTVTAGAVVDASELSVYTFTATAGAVVDPSELAGYTRLPSAGAQVDYVIPPPPTLSAVAGAVVDHTGLYEHATAGASVDYLTVGIYIQTEPGTYSFTAPVTGSYLLKTWAGGGGGEDPNAGHSGTGGGGAGYSQAVVSLTAGDVLSLVVGAGGPHGFGAVPPGGETTIQTSTFVMLCKSLGGLCGAIGGAGGSTLLAVGDLKNRGGNGAPNDGSIAGGGGSSASAANQGNDAVDIQGAAPPPGGGYGGWGQLHDPDQFPKRPGGGGGGGDDPTSTDGDAGADGEIQIFWSV